MNLKFRIIKTSHTWIIWITIAFGIESQALISDFIWKYSILNIRNINIFLLPISDFSYVPKSFKFAEITSSFS